MEKTKVFIAYARKDEEYLNRLRTYLAPLERNDEITMWYDGLIDAGTKWNEEIKTHLHSADLIMLLVSANSLASDYFWNEEMQDALVRHERKEAIVVPVILRHCGWASTDLQKLQALPKDGKPVTAWSDDSAAYYSIFQGIEKNVKKIQKQKKQAALAYAQPNTTATTTSISQNKNNNNFGKTLKIALPILIGIAAIFGVFNWINNQRTISKKEQGINEIAKVNTPVSLEENTKKEKFNSLPEPIQRLLNDMVYVQGGTFEMGCTRSDILNCGHDEKPLHTVTLSNFNIGKYEVTQDQWQTVMGSNPSGFKNCDNRCPVEKVSWNNVQEFIKKLNRMTNKTLRLPTEAEWEYAARGGNRSRNYQYAGSNDVGSVAWYAKNSDDKGPSHPDYGIHTVGTKNPNELSLYDMTGNVSEWCEDWHDADYYKNNPPWNNPQGPTTALTYRVLRGGNWRSNYPSVWSRNFLQPSNSTNSNVGFRLAQTP